MKKQFLEKTSVEGKTASEVFEVLEPRQIKSRPALEIKTFLVKGSRLLTITFI